MIIRKRGGRYPALSAGQFVYFYFYFGVRRLYFGAWLPRDDDDGLSKKKKSVPLKFEISFQPFREKNKSPIKWKLTKDRVSKTGMKEKYIILGTRLCLSGAEGGGERLLSFYKIKFLRILLRSLFGKKSIRFITGKHANLILVPFNERPQC